ncbi:MAG TPA: RNA polymerase factor sigma-54 [Pusillimonas sp.]|uniref:RNA polymerase factor sigma-54 n=1 Tax=Pusillimonas sp. TaxID=3040095 RepID=UPI002BBD50CC|nr:RNA polymerase factor sigma-54 [Pusillimonas sp.]HUH88243.1 RNA polymerase factor sigma-54 [Pusillimonas sp.]
MQSRQSIELRQHQRLALTPQLQQAIRLLQYSSQDLEQEVAQALQDNPLLEQVEEYDTEGAEAEQGDTQSDASFGEARLSSPLRRDVDDDYVRPEAAPAADLRQHLLEQLRLTRATARDRVLVELLIDELDDNGYLVTPLSELVALLPEELGVEREEWQTALRLLQSFDPAGVGAVSVPDCLLLQLDRRETQVGAEVLACARELARDHLSLLATGDLVPLRRQLRCELEVLREARRLLLQLDPKPGRDWAQNVADYVRPEVVVRKSSGRWKASINPAAVPALRVNADYERIIRQTRQTGDAALQQQVQQAHGLIKGIHQRYETILRVAEAVVERQQAFFEQGSQAMAPLVLRDIAQVLGMHESTVSRATRGKYAQTPWGVFELKFFFTTAVGLDDGDATSAAAVRSLIQELVEREPEGKPLSDNRLAALLAERGVVIARRTVAKYREAAGIPAASSRRARARLQGAQ